MNRRFLYSIQRMSRPKNQLLGEVFPEVPGVSRWTDSAELTCGARCIFPLQRATRLVSFTPHMHMRGIGLSARGPSSRAEESRRWLPSTTTTSTGGSRVHFFNDDLGASPPGGHDAACNHGSRQHDGESAKPLIRRAGSGMARRASKRWPEASSAGCSLDDAEYRRQVVERTTRQRESSRSSRE